MSELDDARNEAAAPEPGGWRGALRYGENLFSCLALALLVLLPLSNIVLRKLDWGIPGADAIITHMTLVIGMLGGMLAARERRLLSLSTAEALLKGWGKTLVRVVSSAVGATVSLWLAVAGYKFAAAERACNVKLSVLGTELPTWTIEALLPVGFAVIALRILWTSSEKWRWRFVTFLLFAVFSTISGMLVIDSLDHPDWVVLKSEVIEEAVGDGATQEDAAKLAEEKAGGAWLTFADEEALHAFKRDVATLELGALLLATLMGLPIFAMLGGAALVLFTATDSTIASVPIDHYRLSTDAMLPAIPLFTLAGYFLAEGGASRRLIAVFQALFGSLRGGPAIVTVLVCAFFTSFTGASGVTILALSALLMPVLLQSGYREKTALGLLTGSGSLGMLFPPCLPVILYAIRAEKDIDKLFLAGLLPGLLMVAMTGVYGVVKSGKATEGRPRFELRAAAKSVYGAFWELMIPVVAVVGIFSGVATPVEAAAVTAFYSFIVEVFIYRDLRLVRDVPRVMAKCALLVGGVLLILGVAMGFTNFLMSAQVPLTVVEWVKGKISSPLVFLLCLNGILIVVGCLMDVFSAIIVMVPLIAPLGAEFGIDPLHLGIIFLANLELGFITPPIGMNLFLSSYRFDKPMLEVCRAIVPILLVQLAGVILITYIPPLTLWLPGLFGYVPGN